MGDGGDGTMGDGRWERDEGENLGGKTAITEKVPSTNS